MSSSSEPTSVMTLPNNMSQLRRDSRDPRGIPDEPPRASPIFPDVVLDRAFWVEALTLCHCHASAESTTNLTNSGSPTPARAQDEEASPSTIAAGSGGATAATGSHDVAGGSVLSNESPSAPLSRDNLAVAEHSSWLHRKLFQRYLAQAGVTATPQSRCQGGSESGGLAPRNSDGNVPNAMQQQHSLPQDDDETRIATGDATPSQPAGMNTGLSVRQVPPPPQSYYDGDPSSGSPPQQHERRIGVTATSLESILADVGAPCGSLTAVAIAKNLKYATLDVRDMIRERALDPQSQQQQHPPQSSSPSNGFNGSSVVLTEANVSLLLRAVSMVLARRLVAQRLYRRSAQQEQLHHHHHHAGYTAGTRGPSRSSPASPSRKVVASASQHKGLTIPTNPLHQLPEGDTSHSMAAAVEHAVASSAQRTTGITAGRASSPSRDTRNAYVDTTTPTRLRHSTSSPTASVRSACSSSKGSARIRTGPDAAASPLRAADLASLTSSVADEAQGSARRCQQRSLTAAAELFSTRAAILRSDPFTRSPPVDVNGRPRSTLRSNSSSGGGALCSPSPLRASMERLRASVARQGIGGGGDGAEVASSFAATAAAASTPHHSPRRQAPAHALPNEVSPISRSTSLGGSTVHQRGGVRSSVAPEEPLAYSSPAQVLRGAVPAALPGGGLSPSRSRGTSPSGQSVVLGYNPEHHKRHVQRTFAHVGSKVQDLHISAILHTSSPTTLLLPVGRRAPSSPSASPARQSPVSPRSLRASSGSNATRGRLGAAVPSPTWDHHATLAAESYRSSRSPTRDSLRPSYSAAIDRATNQGHTAALRSSPATVSTTAGKSVPHPPAFQTMGLSHRGSAHAAPTASLQALGSSNTTGSSDGTGTSAAAPADQRATSETGARQELLSSNDNLQDLYKRRLDEEW